VAARWGCEVADGNGYFAADADLDDEAARLRLIEQGSDPGTFQRLVRLGVTAGWRCLEVGAGAGSVAAWLSDQVGPTGHVVAVDIDTRHLDWLTAQNVTVRAHDIVANDLETHHYDLVHCRAVVEHLHDPERAMDQMASALRSGGWLMTEGADFGQYRSVNERHPLALVFDSVMSRTFSFIKDAHIFDPFIAKFLPRLLEDAGLEHIEVEMDTTAVQGGEPMAVMFETSWQRFDPVLTARGILTEAEAAVRHEAHHDPTFAFRSGAVAAWGRHR
jgi:2-polyprenyl-3-methyl-5-hydroxy-6-metoxy-1,4-benzoquinol methylase